MLSGFNINIGHTEPITVSEYLNKQSFDSAYSVFTFFRGINQQIVYL